MANADADYLEVELKLLDETATFVDGARAFVLYQKAVGRIEIGSPFPNDEVWNHFDGDLTTTVVSDGSGTTSGGGGTWNSGELGYLASAPGSGDKSDEAGWIVVERIPERWNQVIVEFGERRYLQTPIKQTAVIPLQTATDPAVRIFGVDPTGVNHLLDEIRLEP